MVPDLEELEALLVVPVEVVCGHCQPRLGVLLQQRHRRHGLPIAGRRAVLGRLAACMRAGTILYAWVATPATR